jgi:peroxiredoxin
MSKTQKSQKAIRSAKRRSNTHIIAAGLMGVGLLALGLAGFMYLLKQNAQASQDYPTVEPAQVNFPAPEINLTDLQGNPVSLKGTQGQFVLVNNWATWCPPCKAEMPVLLAYYEEHKSQNFTVIAIESGEPPTQVADFVQDYEISFPVWADPSQQALQAFRQEYLPTSYLIDPQGQVILFWNGMVSRETLDRYVTPHLEN